MKNTYLIAFCYEKKLTSHSTSTVQLQINNHFNFAIRQLVSKFMWVLVTHLYIYFFPSLNAKNLSSWPQRKEDLNSVRVG